MLCCFQIRSLSIPVVAALALCFSAPELSADPSQAETMASVTKTIAPTYVELATLRVGATWPNGYTDVGAYDHKTGRLFTFTIGSNFTSRTFRMIKTAGNWAVGKAMSFPNTGGTGPVALNETDRRLYVGNNADGKLVTIHADTLKIIGKPIPVASPSGIAIDEASNTLYVSQYDNNAVAVVDGATRQVVGNPIPVGIKPGGGVINPSTRRLYVPNYEGTVTVINLATRQPVKTIPVGIDTANIALNTKTNRLYVSNEQSDTVAVIDGSNDSVIAKVPVGHVPYGVAVNETANLVYAANQFHSNISVIDGASNKKIATVPVGCGGAAPAGCELFSNCIKLGSDPLDIVVDEAANKLYVGMGGAGKIAVLGAE